MIGTDALTGRVAIVTGAARGQGAAAAQLFVAEGARVVIGDVLDDVGKELADSLGAGAIYRHLDVSNEDDWTSVVDEAVETLGGVDVLVNNAGILRFAALSDMPLADYLRVVNVNQVGTFLGMRAVAKPMMAARRGSIVNISSVEGLAGMPYLTAYTSTKFAIRGMTKVAALELGPHGIRVNSVHPGMIETDMVKDAAGGHDVDLSPATKRIALRRMGAPEDIAQVVLFLASDRSAYVTGAELAADGGASATHAFYSGS
ncbi:MAG TPA: glucose 1-dehydrogenase [Jatrophihabitans sp.]|jgi:3alpha(or 20beta)-hydroxysteroid dehydrogenase|nr:glucose 1-dehydrogenase [Jatrophihabitans sp.]